MLSTDIFKKKKKKKKKDKPTDLGYIQLYYRSVDTTFFS